MAIRKLITDFNGEYLNIKCFRNGIGRNTNGFGRTLPDCVFHQILQKSVMDPKI
ncbi:hypothetical protein T4A_1352 [Trichinella pseudospiralis]|uniref:Uncharacterized protein n=1 Tax=Trichinella pseudospiralis TaxID=6337 RepID=A0A0V1DRB1_TRIPS|nr:hypothetical protein T4A_1352 [Trichinella pseudospiralis]